VRILDLRLRLDIGVVKSGKVKRFIK